MHGIHVAELMPVATAEKQGVVNSQLFKTFPQAVNIPKNSAVKILEITSSYTQFVFTAFLTVASYAEDFIVNGRSEENMNNLSITVKALSHRGPVKIYKKDNSLYMQNQSTTSVLTGYVLSTQTIGKEDVSIDDTYTEIPIE